MSPSNAERVKIACAVEGEGYVRHCAAMLHSLLSRHPGAEVHYLHGEDTSARGRRRLREMVERLEGQITFHLIPDAWVDGLPVKGFTGKATWYRFFLPQLLAAESRVLYLDTDLLVLDSLAPLFALELGEHLVAAVSNVLQESDRGRGRWLGLPDDNAYFNAGVLLMNLRLMRAENTSESLLAWSRANSHQFGWRDQDALNVILHERRLALHPRWNCMNAIILFPWATEYFGEDAVAEARANPAIRHFEGPDANKPWHLLSDPEVRSLYRSHRQHTPWPRVRSTGRTPRNLLRYVRRPDRAD